MYIIGPFIFWIGGTLKEASLLQFCHGLGNNTFIQGKPFGDFVLGQRAEVAYNHDHNRLRYRKVTGNTALVEPYMRFSI